jgi:hypothetical protein
MPLANSGRTSSGDDAGLFYFTVDLSIRELVPWNGRIDLARPGINAACE